LQNITRWSGDSKDGVQGLINKIKEIKGVASTLFNVNDKTLLTGEAKKGAIAGVLADIKGGSSKTTGTGGVLQSLKNEIFQINQELVQDQSEKLKKAFENELSNYKQLLNKKKISLVDFNNWKVASEEKLQLDLDRVRKGRLGNISSLSSLTESTLSKGKQTVMDVAKLIGLDPDGASQRFAERIKELGEKIKPIADSGMSNITTGIQDTVSKYGSIIEYIISRMTVMLADGLATGLASIFNQNIKFDFKELLGKMLAALGDMFIGMAGPMIAGGIIANIGLPGSGSAQLASGLKLMALGTGLKAGGMAMSTNASSNAQVNGGGQMGYGSQFMPQSQGITVNITGSLEPIGGDKLGVIINNATRSWNG
jgi:hypothetical protein